MYHKETSGMLWRSKSVAEIDLKINIVNSTDLVHNLSVYILQTQV